MIFVWLLTSDDRVTSLKIKNIGQHQIHFHEQFSQNRHAFSYDTNDTQLMYIRQCINTKCVNSAFPFFVSSRHIV